MKGEEVPTGRPADRPLSKKTGLLHILLHMNLLLLLLSNSATTGNNARSFDNAFFELQSLCSFAIREPSFSIDSYHGPTPLNKMKNRGPFALLLFISPRPD